LPNHVEINDVLIRPTQQSNWKAVLSFFKSNLSRQCNKIYNFCVNIIKNKEI
jgi:hypothetical protein